MLLADDIGPGCSDLRICAWASNTNDKACVITRTAIAANADTTPNTDRPGIAIGVILAVNGGALCAHFFRDFLRLARAALFFLREARLVLDARAVALGAPPGVPGGR